MNKERKLTARQKRKLLQILFVAVAMIIILTIGQFTSSGDIPSWSYVFGCGGYDGSAVVSGSDMLIHAIDVGQGDCILVQGGGANILIDAGDNGMGDKVVSYLRSLGIDHLDMVICSHLHNDHIGGMDAVLGRISADRILMPDMPDEMIPTTRTFFDLLDAIDAQGLDITYVSKGDKFSFGKLSMSVLWPGSGCEYSDGNDYSLVLRFTCGAVAFLTAGDATSAEERDVISSGCWLHSDILKMSHHGSSLSNCSEFLDAVAPRYAFIQCGENNDYGHPHTRLLKRLRSRSIKYERTDLCGNIIYISDGKDIKIETQY